MKDNPFGTLLAIAAVVGFGYFIYTKYQASKNKRNGGGGGGSGRDTRIQ